MDESNLQSSANSAQTFQPRGGRLLVRSLIDWVTIATVVVLVLFIARAANHARGDWWYVYPAIYGVAVMRALYLSAFGRVWRKIKVSDSEVRGYGKRALEAPAALSRRGFTKYFRCTIPIALADLDRERSSQRSVIYRLLGQQLLWSKQGDWVLIQRDAFDADDLRKMFAMLGLPQ